MTIYLGKNMRPYLYIICMVSYPSLLGFLYLTLFVFRASTIERIWGAVIWIGMILFLSLLLIVMVRSCMGKVTINEKGLSKTCLFARSTVYTWGEIASCGLDFRRFNLRYSIYIYIAKENVSPLDYDFKNYPIRSHASDFNVYWHKFLRDHKNYESKNKLLLLFEANFETIQQFKTFIPKYLLQQLENSERRLFEAHPSFK